MSTNKEETALELDSDDTDMLIDGAISTLPEQKSKPNNKIRREYYSWDETLVKNQTNAVAIDYDAVD